MSRRLVLVVLTVLCANLPARAEAPPRLGPFTLGEITATVAIDEMTIPGPAGYGDAPMLQWERARLALDLLHIFDGAAHVERIEMEGAQFTLVRNVDGDWNVSQFRREVGGNGDPVNALSAAEMDPAGTGSLAVDMTVVSNGVVLLIDESVSGARAEIRVTHVEATVQDLRRPMAANRRETVVKFRGDWDGAPGSILTINGRGNFLEAQKSFDLRAEVRQAPLTQFKSYYRGRNIDIRGGTLDADIVATCRANVLDADVALTIHDLQVARMGDSVSARVYGITARQFVHLVQAQNGNFTMGFKLHGDLDDPQWEADRAAAGLFAQAASATLTATGYTLRDATNAVGRELRSVTDKLRGK